MEESIIIPKHVGIILDGNRRWAKEKGLPTILGHSRGIQRTKQLIKYLRNKGTHIVTLYAFSTENWKRTQKEVTYLMRLFGRFISKNIDEFNRDGGRLNILGDITPLPDFLKKMLSDAKEKTKQNSKFIIQIALNYGGRDEIVRTINKILHTKKIKTISEKLINQSLDTEGLPDPDLIIRTSGEQRLSNFLIWQAAYSELYFAPEYLPDFTSDKLQLVLNWFNERERRYGK